MVEWPAQLPPLPLRGMQRSTQPMLAVFTPAVGPAKIRRRSTVRVKPHVVSFRLTRAEAAEFERFFEEELADGALSFSWRDPLSLEAAIFRFAAGAPPVLSERSANRWQLDATLERIG